MPTKTYALEKEAPQNLTLTWNRKFDPLVVTHEGREIGTSHGVDAVKAGQIFTLNDGSKLSVKLETGFAGGGLFLWRDGVAVPGSAADPYTNIKVAAYITYFVAVVNCVLGILAVATSSETLASMGAGIGGIIEGLVFGLLGFFTFRGSLVAVSAALALYVIDWISLFVFAAGPGPSPSPAAGLIMRIIFIFALGKGVMSANELRKLKTSTAKG